MDVVHVAGTGSYAVEIADYAAAAGWELAGFIELIDDARVGTVIDGLAVRAIADVPPGGGRAVVGMGADRAGHAQRLRGAGWTLPPLVHPAAHVSPTARIGDGCIVGPGAVIGAHAVLEADVLVGRGALVGHHTTIAAAAVLNPGANIGGNTSIGAQTRVGMGAVVVNGLAVGAEAMVAAGAVAVRDVPAQTRVQGVPARPFA